MEMPARDPAAAAKAAANQGLVEAMEAAVRFYRAQLNGARAAAARAYLAGPGADPGGAGAIRDRLCAGGADRPARASRGQGLHPRPARRGRARRAAEGGRRLRPLPQPDHVPDPRRPRPGDRLRRPGGRRRAGAEVPELARDPALRQEPHALQPRPGARRRGQGRHPRGDRGLHGRDRPCRGRDRARRRAARHRDHRGPARGALEGRSRAGGRARRRRRRPRRRAAAHRPRAAAASGRTARCASRCCRPARTRTTWCARAAPRRCGRYWRGRNRWSRSSGIARPPASRSTAPSAAPPSTPGSGRISRGSPTPACAPTGSARSACVGPRCSSSRAPPGRRCRARRAGRPASAARGFWRRCRAPGDRCSPATPGGTPRRASARALILAGCLNHPDVALACEDRLERLAFRCPDLGAVRDALVAALATVGPGDGEALRAAIAARLGHDPMPLIAACGPVRANPHVRADCRPRACRPGGRRGAHATRRPDRARRGDPRGRDRPRRDRRRGDHLARARRHRGRAVGEQPAARGRPLRRRDRAPRVRPRDRGGRGEPAPPPAKALSQRLRIADSSDRTPHLPGRAPPGPRRSSLMAAKGPDEPKKPEEGADSGAMLDMSHAAVKKMIATAKSRGYLTYDELNEVLPQEQTTSEQIEDVMSMLSEMGINVIDAEEADDDEAQGEEAPPAEESSSRDLAVASVGGEALDRTDDPGPDVPARDGLGRAAQPRGRDRHRQAHRGRPQHHDRRALREPADLPRHHRLARGAARRGDHAARGHRPRDHLLRPDGARRGRGGDGEPQGHGRAGAAAPGARRRAGAEAGPSGPRPRGRRRGGRRGRGRRRGRDRRRRDAGRGDAAGRARRRRGRRPGQPVAGGDGGGAEAAGARDPRP